MATQTTRDLRTRLIFPFADVVVVVVVTVDGSVLSIGCSSEKDSDDVLDKEAVDEIRLF